MRLDLFKVLIDFLENFEETETHQFEMTHHSRHFDVKRGKELVCGTACCMIGWAATLPEFQKEGLGLYFKDGYPIACLVLNGDCMRGEEICARVLDIPVKDAAMLFYQDFSITDPKQAARKLRSYLKSKGVEL